MNNQYNEPGSALFSIPDIIMPGFSTDKPFENDSSWEESLMIDTKLIPPPTSPGRLQMNPPLPKQLFLANPPPTTEGIPILERPPTFPHQFGGLSRTFPLSLGTSSLDYARAVEGVPNNGAMRTSGEEDGDRRTGYKRQRNGPKHPIPPSSSYAFYVNECRTRLLRARPDLALTDVNREIGQNWSKISASDRQKYHDMEKEDQLRYQREMDALSGDDPNQNALKRRKRDPKAPKHPISAYLFFVAETRARLCKKCPNMGFGQMAKLIGTRWKEMRASDRARYEEMAERDKSRYEREFHSYSNGEDAEGSIRTASRPQTENSKRRKRAHNAPKHPISAYLFFVAEQRRALSASCPGKSFKELATEIGLRWKNLSDEDREPYLLSASSDKERYEREKEKMAGLGNNVPQLESPSSKNTA